MAQLVKRLTLDLGSGHHLTVMRSSPTWGCAQSVEPAEDSFCLSQKKREGQRDGETENYGKMQVRGDGGWDQGGGSGCGEEVVGL